MVTNNSLEKAFTWGDVVIVKANAPIQFKPLEKGSVCGIRTVDSKELAEELKIELGSTLYLVEFGDGQAIEIPGKFLSKE